MKLITAILLSSITLSAVAHESDREITLKAANDELTLRVAELLVENKRLQDFTKKALVAKSQGKTISKGCDPQKLRKKMVTGTDHPDSVNKWINANEANCTKEELTYIKRNVGSWSQWPMFSTHRLLSYLVDQK
jgi:Tfp pilus assembly protein PilX